MSLSGIQIKRIHQALLDAFTRDEFRRLLRTEMDTDFGSLVGDQGASEQFFAIVEWADRTGRIADLLVAALITNPNNAKLSNLIDDALEWPNLAELGPILKRALPAVASSKLLEYEYLAYLRWVVDHNLYLDPRGTFQVQRQVQLRLEEIYVSLQAVFEPTPGQADRTFRHQGQTADLEAESSAIPSITDGQQLISLEQAIADNDAVVILGDPGSGKSTILRYLALRNAQQLLSESNSSSERAPSTAYHQFPILIRIAEFAEDSAWTRFSLTDYLPVLFQKHECGSSNLTFVLGRELLLGNCLILLDGLDEIVDIDARRGIVRGVEEFVQRHRVGGVRGRNRIIITSRFAGYRNAILGGSYKHYAIMEMDLSQIRHFLERWCCAVENAQTPELSNAARLENAQREIDGVLNAVTSSPGVGRLAVNPLMLRTLALIHRTGARLPQRRIELYKLAAETLVLTWRTAQGVPESALMDSTYVTRLLGHFAYWLHSNKPTGTAAEQEVFRIFGAEWATINGVLWNEDDPNPNVEIETRKFLRAVREHTGLVVERAVQQYGFLHLTFEEYYAARHIVRRRNNVALLIRQHLHDLRWDEPILLALGFIGLDYPDEASDLVETAVLAQGEDAGALGLQPSLYEDLLARDYQFAVRCVGDLIPIRSNLVTQIMERFKEELLNRQGLGRYTAYRNSLKDLLSYLQRNTATTPMLVELLERELSEPEKAIDQTSLDILLGLREVRPRLLIVDDVWGAGKTSLLSEMLQLYRGALSDTTNAIRISPRVTLELYLKEPPSKETDSALFKTVLSKLDPLSRAFWQFSRSAETRKLGASSFCLSSSVNESLQQQRLDFAGYGNWYNKAVLPNIGHTRELLYQANKDKPFKRSGSRLTRDYRRAYHTGQELSEIRRGESRATEMLLAIRRFGQLSSLEPRVLDVLFDSLTEKDSEIVCSAADSLAKLTLRNQDIKPRVAEELASFLRRTDIRDADTEDSVYTAFWTVTHAA